VVFQHGGWIVTGIGYILIKERLHESVVGLMWLGTETSGGKFGKFGGGGSP